MAEEFDSDQEKTEEPSQHRIDEFRKRGEVASSRELNSVLVLSASILTLLLSLAFMYETLSEFVQYLYTLDIAFAYTEKSFKTIVETSPKKCGLVSVSRLSATPFGTISVLCFL